LLEFNVIERNIQNTINIQTNQHITPQFLFLFQNIVRNILKFHGEKNSNNQPLIAYENFGKYINKNILIRLRLRRTNISTQFSRKNLISLINFIQELEVK
jgi:hypothetical protein